MLRVALEVLQTLPAPLNARLFGKYLGTTLASLIPMVALYCLGLGLLLPATGNALVFPLGLGIFAAMALPGVLFVSAFSLACPAFIWAPVYQFLLVGYWFWGNLFSPTNGIPTPDRGTAGNRCLNPRCEPQTQNLFRRNETTCRNCSGSLERSPIVNC